MDYYHLILLLVGGLLTGFINTLAGGGSIISLSVLMFLGLDASIANGTNRIAIVFQSLASAGSFRQGGILELTKSRWFTIPAILGSIAGAWIAVDLNKELIEKAIGIVMLGMVFFILYKPELWLKGKPELLDKPVTPFRIVLFFLIGVYGGFIQVGIGYLLLAGLVLNAGYDLVKANALKVFITFVYSPFALIVFIYHNQVHWMYGLVLASGAAAGGLIASRMAIRKGAGFIRWFIVAVILLTCAKVFGLDHLFV
jgi:uncharacterized membrane protein YfcA